MAEIEELRRMAKEIRTATDVGENSAERIGAMFDEMIDNMADDTIKNDGVLYVSNDDWSALDFDITTIYKILFKNNHPVRYKILSKSGDNTFLVGYMEVAGDTMGHGLTELLYTNINIEDGELTGAHTDEKVYLYKRYFYLGGGTSQTPAGTWSKWEAFYDKDALDETLADTASNIVNINANIKNLNTEMAKRELYRIEREYPQFSGTRNFADEDVKLTVRETDTWANLYRLVPLDFAWFGHRSDYGGIYVQGVSTEWLLRTEDGGIKSYNSGSREIGFRVLDGTRYNKLTIVASHDFSVDTVTMRFAVAGINNPKDYLTVTQRVDGYYDNIFTFTNQTTPITNDNLSVIIKVPRYTIIFEIRAQWKGHMTI